MRFYSSMRENFWSNGLSFLQGQFHKYNDFEFLKGLQGEMGKIITLNWREHRYFKNIYNQHISGNKWNQRACGEIYGRKCQWC